MKRIVSVCAILCATLLQLNAQNLNQDQSQGRNLPWHEAMLDTHCRHWTDSVMATLSLREQVAQLFIHTIAPTQDKANLANLRNAVHTCKVGGLLFSGGVTEEQAKLTNLAQQQAQVPLMITFDGEWGLSMRLKNTPPYPRNMVLGCIQDVELITQYGREVARQCREIGVHVNFAPVADVNINPQNPVINTRSFGESPQAVANLVTAYSLGLESGNVLSVSKHFPGHGDTDVDSHHALPVLNFGRERLDSVELHPFKQAIAAGVGGIMVGHLEVPALEPEKGVPASLSRKITHDLLVDELGFGGLIFTDALKMKGVAAHQNLSLKALQAGHDMVLAPQKIKEEIDAVMEALKQGTMTKEDIEAKCRKVLAYKYMLGINKQKSIRLSGLSNRIDTPEARQLGTRLRTAAITLLSNRNLALPLPAAADSVALLNVGTKLTTFARTFAEHATPLTFNLKPDMPAAERKALHAKLAACKHVVVSVNDRTLTPYQNFFNEFAPQTPVTYLCFVPMRQLTQIPQALTAATAVMLCHANDVDIQQHAAHALFGKATVDGRLSAAIGNVFKAGDGHTIPTPRFDLQTPQSTGLNPDRLLRIDSVAKIAIAQGAFPGCQVVILKDGKTVYDKAFGTQSGRRSAAVTPETIYDAASLTKTTATLLAIMKLYDKGLFNLSDKASKYLPALRGTDKAGITIRQLLFHESGLPPTIAFYQRAINKDSYTGTLLRTGRDARHTIQVDARTYAQPKFKFIDGLTSKKPDKNFSQQISNDLWLNECFADSIMKAIVDSKLGRQRYAYSCVGFIVLQKLVEELSGMPLDDFLAKEFYSPMGLQRTAFLPLRFFDKKEIAPSNLDRFLRKDTLQGFVHDEAAAFQGGVSGNAGLFSNAREVALIHQMILNGGELEGRRYLSQETVKLFTTTTSQISHRGLGYNKPNPKSATNTPCSPSTPWSAYGHTGFTGTAAWVDPDNKIVYVFMSNRTFPNMWNNKMGQMDVRGQIQEIIYQAMT